MPNLSILKFGLWSVSLLLTVILTQACQSDRNQTAKITQAKEAENPPNLKTILQSLKPQETSELLLLGLYYHGEDSLIRANQFKNGYRTLLLRYQNGMVSLVHDLPYLATPQADRFYFIGEKNEKWGEFENVQYEETGYEERIYTDFDNAFPIIKTSAAALLAALKKPGKNGEDEIPECPDCEEEVRYYFESNGSFITYVIPGFATTNSWGENYTGGAHGNRYNHDVTVNFPVLLNEKNLRKELPLSFSSAKLDTIKRTLYFRGISGIFIDGGYEDQRKEPFILSDYNKYKIGEAPGNYQINPEERDYVLFHQDGVVKLNIQAHADADYASSGDYNLTTEYEAGPMQIPGFKNSLPFRFSDLVNTDSTIFDCFLSPKQNILVLTRKVYKAGKQTVDENALAVLDVRTGKTLYRQKLPLNVVMAEWATGRSANRWQQLLKP